MQVGDECLRKQHRVLADLHYGQAGRLFQLLTDTPCELLRVQLERVAFAEFQMSGESAPPQRSGATHGAAGWFLLFLPQSGPRVETRAPLNLGWWVRLGSAPGNVETWLRSPYLKKCDKSV